MSDGVEFWMLIISTAAAAVPWAFSIHAKVAIIAETIQTLPKMLEELRSTLEEHEVRLDRHEEEIKAIKVQTATRS
jgi:hypothetical protein